MAISNKPWHKATPADSKNVAYFTSVLNKVVGDTSATFTDTNIHTTSEIHVMYENTAEKFEYYTTATTEGQCVVTFPALTVATAIQLKIYN